MNPVLEGLKALGAARLAALGAVGAGMLVMLGLLALRGGAPSQMSLLYGDLDLREASQMAETLDRAHIVHEDSPQGDRIAVGAGDVARARMLLAKDGLPSGGSIGYEIFDRGDAMTSSAFQQEINETRALEGEIARSIRMLQGMRAARVHLVLPKRQPFSRESQASQASVMLTMAGAARLDPQAVQAVLNLISAAVPGLKPQGIAIIDSRGNLLARAGQPTGDEGVVQTGEELRRATELRLSRAVEEMLEQSLGSGHVRAEAAVQMSFERFNETNETYDPNQQVVRSTQSTSDKNTTTEADKTVSVQNNLPNADAARPQTGSQQARQEETTNYEIGKTVRTLVREQPQLARISLAVMVDGVTARDAAGKPVWTERPAAEMDRIKRLVQSAIGFDAKRGDTVEVLSMRFASAEEVLPAPPSGLFGFSLEKSDLISLGQSAILAIVVLLALVFVLRPMALRLSTAPQDALGTGPAGLLDQAGAAAMAAIGATARPGPSAVLLADESMVNMANIEGQIRASSIRKVAELVEKHPEASLSIMRGWMAQEQGRSMAASLRDGADQLSGAQKAAALMLALGEDHAARLFSLMHEDEIKEVSGAMSQLGSVRAEMVEKLCHLFTESIGSSGALIGNFENTERLLQKTMPRERVAQIMEEIRGPAGRTMWDKLGNVNEAVLANYLKNEYPQTVAVVLSKVRADHAARVLTLLPESFAMEVVTRMLRMESVQREVLDGVERTLRAEFMSNLARSTRRDTHEIMADIFNNLDRATETRFLSALEERNHEAAERIKALMFTFDDLSRVTPASMQVLMRNVDKEKLPLAMKGASEKLRELFLKSLSERAGKMLMEEVSALGPVKLRDVDEAQASIVATAKELSQSGELDIGGGKDEEMIE